MIDALISILGRHRVPDGVYDDLARLAETENEEARQRFRSPLLPEFESARGAAVAASLVDDGRPGARGETSGYKKTPA